ncbi:MAG: hypothetical protein IJH76_03270 [Clostridia bacterium]|nr:hypothetical protein [Clostridia bacterium]
MLDKIKKVVNQRYFHIIVIVVIVIILLFILLMTMLDYNENGEKNMPFNLSKITVISTSEGMDKQVEGKKWAFDIDQNNDIFLYIEKNDKNQEGKQAIESIVLENFSIKRENKNGEVKIYKPDSTNEKQIFTNKEENVENVIIFKGDTESNFKNLKISNQGDVLAFRCATKNIASYESDAEEEINHGELLKKAGVTLEDLKENLTFDITINLHSGKSYKAQIKLDLPAGNIIEEATTNTEITDLSDIAFKRVNN